MSWRSSLSALVTLVFLTVVLQLGSALGQLQGACRELVSTDAQDLFRFPGQNLQGWAQSLHVLTHA